MNLLIQKQLLVLITLFLIAYTVKGQKGYLSFKIAYPIVGTPSVLKSDMRKAGFDHSTTMGFVMHYPYATEFPSVAAEWGRYIKENTSFSLLAGLQEAGEVRGYNTNNGSVRIRYTNWVLNPRMNFHRQSAILGAGASVLWLRYKRPAHHSTDYKHSKVLPGLSLSAESITKKKRGFRLGVFGALHLHPGFTIPAFTVISNAQRTTFQGTLNPSTLLLGMRIQLFNVSRWYYKRRNSNG